MKLEFSRSELVALPSFSENDNMLMNLKKTLIFSTFSDIKEIHCYGNVHGLTLPMPRGRGGEARLSQLPSCFSSITFIRIKLFKRNFG